MLLTDKKINHINAISHDGKVVCFGTGPDGAIWYTVKRSGFEDTAVAAGTDPFGFEGWKMLNLGAAVADASVTADEQQNLTDTTTGNVLVRTVYGSSDEITKSADAPVQLVSSANLLYVLRQSRSTGKILVNRFVLDGMTNELVPKLEVRFRRNKQRLTPHKPATPGLAESFDNLDYRDIDGNPFYEGALELGFAGNVLNGWFSVLNVSTIESDRSRWHLFVVDAASSKLVLYTVGGGDDGLFDVKDYLFALPDPTDPTSTVYSSIPGIVRRTIDLQGLTIANGPSATSYHLQREVMTDAGPQLILDAARVMLAVPVQAGSDPVKTAVVDFALAVDGMLSQIDLTPDASPTLRSDMRQVVTPPTLMDGIKEIAAASPPPAGTIVATERGGDDQLQIRSRDPLPPILAAGSKVKIRGTRSYDGHYKVLSKDGATFQVAATFANNEAGFWEVSPDRQTGLVFNNQVVGTEKTADGKLKILCSAHDLTVGDEVQISGTQSYDGVFPITAIVADKNGFVLDAPFFTGEAANVSKVIRRGLRMDGNDSVETPDLALVPPSPERDMGRTLSAWVKVDAAGNMEQSLIKDSGGMMSLSLGSDKKVKLTVRMSDGVTRVVTDPSAIATNTWVHYAGTFDYATANGGNTRIALVRNGVEVAQLTNQELVFDGVDDYIQITTNAPDLANKSFSVECWARRTRLDTDEYLLQQGTAGVNTTLHIGFRASNAFTFAFYGNDLDAPTASTDRDWHHWACTYDAASKTRRIYRDGSLLIEQTNVAPYQGSGTLFIGRHAGVNLFFNGSIRELRIWNRVRTAVEIAQETAKRLTGGESGLLALWPLDSGTAQDLSPAKRDGALMGNPVWKRAASYPQIVPPAALGATLAKAMSFNGTSDYIEVPAGTATFTGGITVEAWVCLEDPAQASTGRGIFTEVYTGAADSIQFAMHVDGANHTLNAGFFDGTWRRVTAPSGLPLNRWVHVAATYDNRYIRIYIDGMLIMTSDDLNRSLPTVGTQWRIGRRQDLGNPSDMWKGRIADVRQWNVARAQADIQAGMYSRLTGKESGLVGYWPLDRDAGDRSPNKRNGSFKGNPALVNVGSAHSIGQGFSGEIAGAEIWEVAQTAADVNATMNLDLSGKEEGLAAYYRMGAISYEEQPPVVPDFSYHGRNGVVVGDAYAGARRLNRAATGTGLKVVKYGSEELLAVSQRGRYEESFEFSVLKTDASSTMTIDTNFNPASADGAGSRLFAFSYWGKSSRGSKEIITVPAASVTQSAFASLGGGWYKATCTVVIPDGMSLLRAFEISDVRGKWGAELAPPATEWTAIDIRRHQIRLISDAVTRATYTDPATLTSLPAQSQSVLNNLAAISGAEARVTRAEATVRDLLMRIDVAQNNQPYLNERDNLTSMLSSSRSQKTAAQNDRKAITDNRYSYYHRLRVKHSQKFLTSKEEFDGFVEQFPPNGSDSQLWRIEPQSDSSFKLFPKRIESSALHFQLIPDGSTKGTAYASVKPFTGNSTWNFLAAGDDYYYITTSGAAATAAAQRYAEVTGPRIRSSIVAAARALVPTSSNVALTLFGGAVNDSQPIFLAFQTGADYQRYALEQTDQLTGIARAAVAGPDENIRLFDQQIASNQQRLDWLNQALAGSESVASVQTLLTNAQTELKNARTDLAAKNTDVLKNIAQAAPATMPPLVTDARALVTTGAVLDFAQPTGRVRLAASSEGNVLLTYFDTQGRMRATPYDAAADSRNAAFEQWVPDAARACADVRKSVDKITLARPVSLPASGWTCEAWVQYPLATRINDADMSINGTAYETNVVAAGGAVTDSPLIVRRGTRLGLMAGGWFFDSGADLPRTLAPGWHHLAAASREGTTTFYADGRKLGSRTTVQPAIHLNGSTDYIEVPAHANPTAAITVSIWARSATPTWNNDGFLVSKRNGNAFLMSPLKGTRTMEFYVWNTDGGVGAPQVTPDDIQDWHLYTGTYDGSKVRLYVDGELRAEAPLTGAIRAVTGVMNIGSDRPDAANLRYFNGDIAEVAIWSVARGPGEVREDLYRTFTGTEPNLFGYWRMDNTSGTGKIKDLSSNGRDGTVKGSPMDATIMTMRSMDITALGNFAAGGSPIGRLAEVRMWNIALSDAEIAVHARVKASGDEPGLLGYWPLDEATGATAYDRSASGQSNNGTMSGVSWAACTANIGNPGTRVLSLPDSGGVYVTCPTVAIAGKSFTVECWARRSGAGFEVGRQQYFVAMGTGFTSQSLLVGFHSNQLKFSFWADDLVTPVAYTDTDWHHWCCTYDKPSKKQRIYRDGVMVAERTASADCAATGPLIISRYVDSFYFLGDLAELRIWDRVRTDAEIRTNMYRRATGTEPNLLACYPLDDVSLGTADSKVREKKTGQFQGTITGNATLLLTTSMPGAGADNLIAAEYSTVEVSGEGTRQALLRRFYGYTTGEYAELLPEQRVEELTLQWAGNTQLKPTLLGYIEGAPPVPSENLTFPLALGYGGASTVALTTSEGISYNWKRSEATELGLDVDAFLGGQFGVKDVSELKFGIQGNLKYRRSDAKSTSITATSALASSNSLALTGRFEDKAAFPAVGKRWVPKNVGYALVVSGTADVFITKLKRSGRMVSYDIRPADGVPMDLNTITFLINPAYTLNGSLDGMVGSASADPTFYANLREMRAQYGSLFPASYFRLKDAYILKNAIDKQDVERRAFFFNFRPDSSLDTTLPTNDAGAKEAFQETDAAQAEVDKRKKEIEDVTGTLREEVRAKAAFADWQLRLESLQRQAGKRNIVNEYVWDGDGGLRADEESFAATIEHSISAGSSIAGGIGFAGEGYGGFIIKKAVFKASVLFAGSKASAFSKTLTESKALALTVSLAGVERRGITDLKDRPLVPGEKVDRYRFMSFYLEGHPNHFHNFFSYVVDPEWLASNDEEARALRQVDRATPNKTWRVLHRVTYVERPALGAFDKKLKPDNHDQ